MRKTRLFSTLLALGAGALLVRLWPSIARRASSELRWRAGRARTAVRSRLERRVSIMADMGRPPHRTVIWSGFASEAEAVREKLPEEFGRTWIVDER